VKVFLDTNVLVSAFVTRGLCADLLRLVLTEHELVVGEVVLAELRRVLVQRVGVPPPVVDEIERFLGEQSVAPNPARHLSLGLRDPDDEWIIASAAAGNVDLLVTGDADILQAEARLPVRAFTARRAWHMLRE